MSTLLVTRLNPDTVVTQRFKALRSLEVAHIRPWVYIHGTLEGGQLNARVMDSGVILKQVSISADEINTAKTETYAHGRLRIDFGPLFLGKDDEGEHTEYTVELEYIGHVSGGWMGVVKDWDSPVYNSYGETPKNDSSKANGVEFFERYGGGI